MCRDFMTMEYCENGDLFDFITAYTSRQAELSVKGLYKDDKVLL